jgi:hypothetical protein
MVCKEVDERKRRERFGRRPEGSIMLLPSWKGFPKHGGKTRIDARRRGSWWRKKIRGYGAFDFMSLVDKTKRERERDRESIYRRR